MSKSLQTFTGDVKDLMDTVTEFPTGFNKLFSQSNISCEDQLESLAIDTACKFMFGDDSEFHKRHRTFLLGTAGGYCQYVSDGQLLHKSTNGFAFIPISLLQTIEDSDDLKPCSIALRQLGKAILEYGKVPYEDEEGVAFKSVVLNSLLLFARSNPRFNLQDLCISAHSGDKFDAHLRGGPHVQLWTDIAVFPRNARNDDSNNDKSNDDKKSYNYESVLTRKIKGLVNRLQRSGASGAIFQPTDMYNMGGDIYGLFRDDSGYILLVVQCKDWSVDTAHAMEGTQEECKPVEDCFRVMLEEFPDNEFWNGFMEVELLGDQVRVERRLLVFCANKQTSPAKMQSYSAMISLQDMRRWLPTAAYASEMALESRTRMTNVDE